MMLNLIKGFYLFGIEVRFYGIIMAIAMAIGVFVACKNAKYRNLNSENILLLACYVLPLAVVGARIFSFVSEIHLYESFWQIFNLRTGGMSIFGGIIGGAVAILLYCLIHKKNFFAIADIAVPSLILGQAIGRWGNFFNQEVYGFEVTNPSLQWFPFSVFIESTGKWHLATFFYEFLLNLIIFIVLMLMLRKFKVKERGVLMASYLIMYGVVRACLEPLRVPQYILYIGSVRISLLTSIICAVLGVSYFIYLLIKNYLINKKEKSELFTNKRKNISSYPKEIILKRRHGVKFSNIGQKLVFTYKRQNIKNIDQG